MTATIHKVAAGNGYQYYLRNVAANDVSARGRSSLADYYSAHGEAPGRWHGTGLDTLGLQPGAEVTEEQMKSLFGLGRHPNAEVIEARVYDSEIGKGAKHKDAARAADQASRLGNPFRVYAEVSEFRKRCADAFTRHNIKHGFDPHDAISDDERARIRTRVAFDMFCETYDRPPLNERELSGWVAQNSRPNTVAVAGFDITFSPVKSVSALWALAPRTVAEKVELAHRRAVHDALAWLEEHAIFTRLGRNGVRQVDVQGIVAACFTHRDSRAGDPDLHTHVLIANRVRTHDGKWRTLDGTAIYRAVVTVSEIYNTRLEHHLEDLVGVEFAERPTTDPSKRPIREIVGIPTPLIEAWSRREAAIKERVGKLAARFQHRFDREPTPTEMYALAQQATLETRPPKHLLRSLAEQRSTWRSQAMAMLGGREALSEMIVAVVNPVRQQRVAVTTAWINRTAQRVIEVVSEHRSTWTATNLRAEIERQLRGHVRGQDWEHAAEAVLAETLSPEHVIARGDPDLTDQPELRTVPELLRRRDSTSVYTSAGAQVYTSARMLSVEQQLIDLSVQPGARQLPMDAVTAAVHRYNTRHPDRPLNAGQIGVIRGFASSGLRVRTTNAPAGTGKTTAMAVLTDAWHTSGGRVLGLAPTASAAAELGKAIGARVETVDKVLDVLDRHTPNRNNPALDREQPPSLPQWILDIDPDTLVIVDEHVKIGNLKRLRLLRFLTDRGATIRCIGDPHQLASIEAGGADTDMDAAAPEASMTLTHVVRFASNAEATASLQLREGDPAALAWYLDNGRIHAGHEGATHDDAYTAWITDHLAGRDTIMLAATHDIVTELNARARADRIARDGGVVGAETFLTDGLRASVGDTIRTRRNHRRLRLGTDDWVRNGYTWTVAAVHADGSVTATHLRSDNKLGHSVRLPADYVATHVRLGYATTIDSAQGITTDSCHVALTGGESRQQLYVALTRGIHANHAYVPTALDGSEGSFWSEPAAYPRTAVEIMLRIFGRDGAQKSAHTVLRDALDPHQRIGRALDIYLDALGVAAENALGPAGLERLDAAAEAVRPNLTDSPAYPVLRQHLAMIALSGRDPITALHTAANARELDTADDVAAVLDWRLDPSGAHSTIGAPLPWASGIPRGLRAELDSTQVTARARIVADLSTQIRTDVQTWTPASAPHWARPLIGSDPRLLEDLAVWRASLHIDDGDPRLTGPARYTVLEREHQQLLDARVTDTLGDIRLPANKWAPLITRLQPRILTDPWWPILADKIEVADRSGIDIQTRLTHAAALRALPDDMPAAGLWSRLELELVAAEVTDAHNLTPDWTNKIHQIIGEDTAHRVINDPAWPRLVAAIDRATGTDWTPAELLTTAHELILAAQPDDAANLRPDQYANALAWRIDALLHEPTHPDQPDSHPSPEPTMHPPEHPPHDPEHRDTTAQPTPRPPIRPLTTSTVDETPLSEDAATIAALIQTGDLRTARRAFHDLADTLTDEQRDIIEHIATTLYRNHFSVALARLRWAADQYPEHRELIRACTPATDPHVYQSDTDRHQPPNQPDQRIRPTHHYPDRQDPTRVHPPRTDTEIAAERASQDYLDTHGDLDTDPEHLPMPDGVPHHYYREKLWEDRYPDSTAPDYDRQTTDKTQALPCVSCGITRARIDSRPRPPRRSDDGLCGECRTDNQPGIPDHLPAEYIRARCDYIANTHPPNTILGLLKRDWHAARTLAERLAIATWVEQHPLPDTSTEPSAPPSEVLLDVSDPVQMLTDDQLSQAITEISQRIALAETEAILYGPAPGTGAADTETAASDTTTWLQDELVELNTEQHRRSQLTPEQTAAEHALRTRHQHHDITDDTTEFEPEPLVDPPLGYDDIGL
ncbi:MobF family relaxase [Nocardia pseudovaccinii]|uniref:MobF family relaxase n=1 Tax=Nocardia pseudovaccinii TaxID=189540 RepID=UPI0007A48831|nr:MobF family relaxase [Nocardia pseudovaccinii]